MKDPLGFSKFRCKRDINAIFSNFVSYFQTFHKAVVYYFTSSAYDFFKKRCLYQKPEGYVNIKDKFEWVIEKIT